VDFRNFATIGAVPRYLQMKLFMNRRYPTMNRLIFISYLDLV